MGKIKKVYYKCNKTLQGGSGTDVFIKGKSYELNRFDSKKSFGLINEYGSNHGISTNWSKHFTKIISVGKAASKKLSNTDKEIIKKLRKQIKDEKKQSAEYKDMLGEQVQKVQELASENAKLTSELACVKAQFDCLKTGRRFLIQDHTDEKLRILSDSNKSLNKLIAKIKIMTPNKTEPGCPIQEIFDACISGKLFVNERPLTHLITKIYLN